MRRETGLDPEEARAWIRVARDALIVIVGSFLLVWQGVFVQVPNLYVIGAGLAALGLPPVLRLDEARRRDADDAGERWTHLP